MNESIRVIHNGSWGNQPGGGERVAREIARALNARVTVGHTSDPSFWSEFDPDIPFQPMLHKGLSGSFYNSYRQVGDLRLAQRFRELDFPEDILITSGTQAKWIHPRPDQTHIHYCHFPPEQLYSAQTQSTMDWSVKTPLAMLDRYFSNYIDVVVANSEYTSQYANRYYSDCPIEVIEPPVNTDAFWWRPPRQEPYYVMIGRLTSKKRARLVAEAFQERQEELILVGDGPQRRACRDARAKVYTELSQQALGLLVARSHGGIAFAQEEHFGITPKEFQAAGKPVIVPDEPNLCNHVTDGRDGVIVEPTKDGVQTGIDRAQTIGWDKTAIQQTAADYTVERFQTEIRDLVDRARNSQRHQTPPVSSRGGSV